MEIGQIIEDGVRGVKGMSKNKSRTIGLFNTEPGVENTAMMQVSKYHKQLGDKVEQYSPIFPNRYDLKYAFSIYKFSDKSMVTKDMIIGGTGFDNNGQRLPKEIEDCNLDYSIFPKCKTSYIWFSRGCIRKCPFCVVPKKEGFINSVEPKNLNPNGEYISVMDNNFFANPKWRESINQLVEWNQLVDFQSGIDVRLFNEEQGNALQKIRLYKQIHIAWDNPKEDPTAKMELLKRFIHPYKIMAYVLIGYWSTPEEDLMRVEKLRELKVDPFVMPYDKKNKYQKAFARWVNHKAVFKSVKWEDYSHGEWK